LGAAADELARVATTTRVDPADREQVDGFFRGLGGLEHLVLAVGGAAAASTPLPGAAGLAASNGAPEAMIPALAAELKPIRVDAVSPGVTHTPWWHGLPDAERAALFAQSASATSV